VRKREKKKKLCQGRWMMRWKSGCGGMEGYECMIGVFLVSDFGMIYRDLMHRI
jgi:hypothetical protein